MASQYRYSGRQHAGYRPVNTSPDRHASPARGGATPGIQNPQEFGLNSRLETAMINVRKSMRPGGTKNTLDGKVEEYNQYCELVYPTDQFKYNLSSVKVYRFMFYLTFRNQKARGKPKGGVTLPKFDLEDYRNIMATYYRGDESADDNVMPEQPKNPISLSSFESYKQALRGIYKDQVAMRVINLPWDHIWTGPFDNLKAHVKERIPHHKKANYHEKVTSEFQPYETVEKFPDIEAYIWDDSHRTTRRSIHCGLRHRYTFLHLTSGILRCESLPRAELSDFMFLTPPKKDLDIHKMDLMINQIAPGTTNHGRVLYGRAARHKSVELCCIGALAFYLMFRFFCTGEFKEMSVDDWLDNSRWFDIKLLTDVNSNDNTSAMQSDGYGKAIERILKKLKLMTTKLLHLGRNVGSKILDLLEEESEAIRRMGQWNPSIFDNSYSSKLPMGPIRKLAGYHGNNKMYFNTRTNVQVPEELLRMTPIGEWVYDIMPKVMERAGSDHPTCLHVLNFFAKMNKIFLQDAAAMLVKCPDRAGHPIFDQLPLFVSPEFQVSGIVL